MPRSVSRDVVDRFAGNRGYFHRADPLHRWKNLVALAALGLVLGWLVVEFAWPARAPAAHTHGELASPHAAFDSNCQACHVDQSAERFASPFAAHDRWHQLDCTKCHASARHHNTVRDAAFHEQCSNCHHDHQGRSASLTRLDDSHCTRCHAELNSAHAAGNTEFVRTITNFAKDHPPFRSLQIDRGLKFSHALHMTPGLVYDPNDPNKLTAEKLGDGKARYLKRGGDAKDAVQLECTSCHALDSGRSPETDLAAFRAFDLNVAAVKGASRNALLPPRSEGRYYLPINFDLHCKTCHPQRTASAVSEGIVLEPLFVPHRRQSSDLRELLKGEFAAHLASRNHPAFARPIGPGGRLDSKTNPAPAPFEKKLDRLADEAVKKLLSDLQPSSEHVVPGGSCGKCHYSTGTGSTEILKLPDRAVWLTHATFNHVSHKAIACGDCHPGTEAAFAPGGRVNEREPVLISGIKSCQACHAPSGWGTNLTDDTFVEAAGIRHACTDCHRYHNGDHPLQGLGAAARTPHRPQLITEFLRGGVQP